MYWKFAIGFKGDEREIKGQEDLFKSVIKYLGGSVEIENPVNENGDILSVFIIKTEE